MTPDNFEVNSKLFKYIVLWCDKWMTTICWFFPAVKSNNMEIARQLIGHGARPNVQIYCGTSPLHQAASEGFSDVVLLLLDSGAKLDIREEYDITPIFSAAQYGQVDCLGILLEKAKQTGL